MKKLIVTMAYPALAFAIWISCGPATGSAENTVKLRNELEQLQKQVRLIDTKLDLLEDQHIDLRDREDKRGKEIFASLLETRKFANHLADMVQAQGALVVSASLAESSYDSDRVARAAEQTARAVDEINDRQRRQWSNRGYP